MATIHKISEGLLVDSFDLIAVHSGMEHYALAYHINKVVQLKLGRSKKDLEKGEFSFPMYEWCDEVKGLDWFLVNNTVRIEEYAEGQGLFQDNQTIKTGYLIEERKEIDYLLKINPEDSVEKEIAIKEIRNIPKVSMAYQIDVEALKSRKNLIF